MPPIWPRAAWSRAKIDPEHFVHTEEVAPDDVIRKAAAGTDIAALIAGFRPPQNEYDRLKAALKDYRALAAAGGWPDVPPGPTLKPGMTDRRIGRLRARLQVTGDLTPASGSGDPNHYDEALVGAVKQFQYRHGLELDGKVGKNTLAALNVSTEGRVEQMLLNMERRRWMQDDRGERYVMVNLADFVLKVVDGPKTVFDTRVVVGAPYHRTPVFSHKMTYIVVNPYWNVTSNIARKEMLPKIKKDVGYLAANNLAVLNGWGDGATKVDPASVDWQRLARRNFPYRIRQEPGPGNALGRIKFMLPNRFHIYLHDTPAKKLFDKASRSFSHGCIRVQDPDVFGSFVLSRQPEWSLE